MGSDATPGCRRRRLRGLGRPGQGHRDREVQARKEQRDRAGARSGRGRRRSAPARAIPEHPRVLAPRGHAAWVRVARRDHPDHEGNVTTRTGITIAPSEPAVIVTISGLGCPVEPTSTVLEASATSALRPSPSEDHPGPRDRHPRESGLHRCAGQQPTSCASIKPGPVPSGAAASSSIVAPATSSSPVLKLEPERCSIATRSRR